MESLAMAKEIVKAFEEKIGTDIMLLKVGELTTLAEYFVICTGSSTTQVKALADEVEFRFEKLGLPAPRREGKGGDIWVLLDCGEVIAHVFTKEARNYYGLEKLWADGQIIDID